MAKGAFTGTAASTEIVAANAYRDGIILQHTNATAIEIGIGEAAVAGSGVKLIKIGDTLVLRGADARAALYGIGNGGTLQYQTIDTLSDFHPVLGT